jgi:hypothetical protein
MKKQKNTKCGDKPSTKFFYGISIYHLRKSGTEDWTYYNEPTKVLKFLLDDGVRCEGYTIEKTCDVPVNPLGVTSLPLPVGRKREKEKNRRGYNRPMKWKSESNR